MPRKKSQWSRPRGRPREAVEARVYEKDYGLAGFCRWCGKYSWNEKLLHVKCRREMLNKAHGAAFWCLNPACDFYTTDADLCITHAMNMPTCRDIYSVRFQETVDWMYDRKAEAQQDSKVDLRPSSTRSDVWVLPTNKEVRINAVFADKEKRSVGANGALSSSQAQVQSTPTASAASSSLTEPAISAGTLAGTSPATSASPAAPGAAHQNARDDDPHISAQPLEASDVESEPELSDEDDDAQDAQAYSSNDDEGTASEVWIYADEDLDTLLAGIDDATGPEADLASAQEKPDDVIVTVHLDPIDHRTASVTGVQQLANYVQENLFRVDAARADLKTTARVGGAGLVFARVAAESGTSMAAAEKIRKSVSVYITEVLERARQRGLIPADELSLLHRELTFPPLARTRANLREASKSYVGHAFKFVFDLKKHFPSPETADLTYSILLRDPIALAHDIVAPANILTEGDELRLHAQDASKAGLQNFCDGDRYRRMQAEVRKEVRRAKQGAEGGAAAQKWAGVDPESVCALPLAFFIDDTHVCKSGALTQCPIIMTVLWFDSKGLRRDSTKRILGYIPPPPKVELTAAKAAILKQVARQAAFRAILDLVRAWQLAAIREGGLVWRTGDGQLVRSIPAPALFIGDNKELNVLSGTIERTRCRMCSANVRTLGVDEAPATQPSRDFLQLKRDFNSLRAGDRTTFKRAHGLQVDGTQSLFETRVNFFAGKDVYPMFCFDTMHTLTLGPVRDTLIAVLSSVQFRSKKTRKVKTLDKLWPSVKAHGGGLPTVQAGKLAKLQQFMHQAGYLPCNALERNRLEAKHIPSLARATLTAFLHDLTAPTPEDHVLPLAKEFRIVVWALAAAARVSHELIRPTIDPLALPAAREQVRELIELVQRYRLLGEYTEVTTLKLHALSHMVYQIAYTGGTAFCDTASFEHYHLLVAMHAKLVNNTDTSGLHMLRRAMEMDAARVLCPDELPKEPQRTRLVGGQSGAPHRKGVSLVDTAATVARHIANVVGASNCPVDIEKTALKPLEGSIAGASAVDLFVKAEMSSIRLRAAGDAPFTEGCKPPSLMLTRDRKLFLPLAFIRLAAGTDAAPPSAKSGIWAVGATVNRDEDLHKRIARTTYRKAPLSGFAIVDLSSLANMRADHLQVVLMDDLAAGEMYWLHPRPQESGSRRVVFWPIGSVALNSWQSYPVGEECPVSSSSSANVITNATQGADMRDELDDVDDTALFANTHELLNISADPPQDEISQVQKKQRLNPFEDASVVESSQARSSASTSSQSSLLQAQAAPARHL